MTQYTPTLVFGALVELCGLLTLFLVARGSDGRFSPPVVGFAAFLIVVGTAITFWAAVRISQEKRGR